jgi:hypothetical protein
LGREGSDASYLGEKGVPGFAAGLDDGFVAVEHPVGKWRRNCHMFSWGLSSGLRGGR